MIIGRRVLIVLTHGVLTSRAGREGISAARAHRGGEAYTRPRGCDLLTYSEGRAGRRAGLVSACRGCRSAAGRGCRGCTAPAAGATAAAPSTAAVGPSPGLRPAGCAPSGTTGVTRLPAPHRRVSWISR